MNSTSCWALLKSLFVNNFQFTIGFHTLSVSMLDPPQPTRMFCRTSRRSSRPLRTTLHPKTSRPCPVLRLCLPRVTALRLKWVPRCEQYSLCRHLAHCASQPLFVTMKTLLFVGGYKPDKKIFALVSDDNATNRFCHIFSSEDQVMFPSSMTSFLIV